MTVVALPALIPGIDVSGCDDASDGNQMYAAAVNVNAQATAALPSFSRRRIGGSLCMEENELGLGLYG